MDQGVTGLSLSLSIPPSRTVLFLPGPLSIWSSLVLLCLFLSARVRCSFFTHRTSHPPYCALLRLGPLQPGLLRVVDLNAIVEQCHLLGVVDIFQAPLMRSSVSHPNHGIRRSFFAHPDQPFPCAIILVQRMYYYEGPW